MCKKDDVVTSVYDISSQKIKDANNVYEYEYIENTQYDFSKTSR